MTELVWDSEEVPAAESAAAVWWAWLSLDAFSFLLRGCSSTLGCWDGPAEEWGAPEPPLPLLATREASALPSLASGD